MAYMLIRKDGEGPAAIVEWQSPSPVGPWRRHSGAAAPPRRLEASHANDERLPITAIRLHPQRATRTAGADSRGPSARGGRRPTPPAPGMCCHSPRVVMIRPESVMAVIHADRCRPFAQLTFAAQPPASRAPVNPRIAGKDKNMCGPAESSSACHSRGQPRRTSDTVERRCCNELAERAFDISENIGGICVASSRKAAANSVSVHQSVHFVNVRTRANLRLQHQSRIHSILPFG